MADPQRHIERLHVRVPGAAADAGPRVAEALTHALARLPPAARSAEHGDVRLRVRVSAGASEADIARAIATAIADL